MLFLQQKEFMENYLKFLQTTELFNNINETEILAVSKCLNYKVNKYAPDHPIYTEGDKIDCIGMVAKGTVHIVQNDFWGNRNIVSKLTPGDLFGEVFAFSKDSLINVSVIALENCEVIFFPFSRLISVCGSACDFHNRLIRNLLNIVAEKNFLITTKLRFLSHRSTRNKLIAYLFDEYKKQGKQNFSIPFNRQELADYLLIDRSAMSNELSKMRKEGILDFHKNVFRFISYPVSVSD